VESHVASVWKKSYESWKQKGTNYWTRDQSFMRSATIRKNLARANSNRWRKTSLRVSDRPLMLMLTNQRHTELIAWRSSWIRRETWEAIINFNIYIYIYIYITIQVFLKSAQYFIVQLNLIIYEIKYKTNVVTQSFMPEFTDNLRTTKVLLTKFDRFDRKRSNLVNRNLVVRRLSVNAGMKLWVTTFVLYFIS
jgi:hypothetical protein